jgi:hypothetical protein
MLAIGCSGAPSETSVRESRVQGLETLRPAEAHPTSLVIDETFDAWQQLGIEDAAADWCTLEPTLCLEVTVGPVTVGQANSVMRDTVTPGCPAYGVEHRDTAQITIPDSCATADREHHMTVGLIAAHELGHFISPTRTRS